MNTLISNVFDLHPILEYTLTVNNAKILSHYKEVYILTTPVIDRLLVSLDVSILSGNLDEAGYTF